MERAKSRSPSLSRRHSLKEKKGVVLLVKGRLGKVAHPGGHSSGKKERWLLTRKTWRYMSDAVGNLLPEVTSRGGSGGGRRGSASAATSAATAGKLQPYQLQQWSSGHGHSHSQGGSGSGPTSPPSTSTSTTQSYVSASPLFAAKPSSPPAVGGQPGSSGHTHFPFPFWGGSSSAFPSHRPGVTPTGPGPGPQGSAVAGSSGGSGGRPHFGFGSSRYINPAVDPENIPQVEEHFQDVCTREPSFLLWNRKAGKGLSGPRLRALKLQLKEEEEEADYLRMEEGGGYFRDEEDEDEYGEYGAEDEEQITVRERRKSSTASSTMSILGTPGSCFFRPLSSSGMVAGSGAGAGSSASCGPSSGSETTYTMVGGSGGSSSVSGFEGLQRIVRNTGTQTEPFPEELLIRLRLQAVHDERQRALFLQQQQQQSPPGCGSASGSGSGPPCGAREFSPDETPGSPNQCLVKDSNLNSVITEGEAVGGAAGGGSGSGTSATTGGGDQCDKKSEESGYSSSISDTVMKYLRIMRKNSKADNKETIDRFKTVNYDRSLRYIKSKNVTLEEALEHEKNKALGKAAKDLPQTAEPQAGPVPQEVPKKTGKKMTTKKKSSATPSLTTSPVESPSVAEKPLPGQEELVGVTMVTTTTSSSSTATAVASPQTKPLKKCKSSSGTTSTVKGQLQLQKTATSTAVAKAAFFEEELSPTSLPQGQPQIQQASAQTQASAQAQAFAPPPPKEVGIQAGESLIRYLRKFSESSESPSLSPRLSIATYSNSSGGALGGDYYEYHATHFAASGASQSQSSSGIPTTTRSSFDMYSDSCSWAEGQGLGLGQSQGQGQFQGQGDGEWISQLIQYQQQMQIFQEQSHQTAQFSPPSVKSQSQGPAYSHGHGHGHDHRHLGLGGGQGGGPALSPIPASSTGSSTSTSQKQLNIKISSSPSIPQTTSTSSGGSSASLMKSFFSSPFRSSSKKPSSTTSLVNPPVTGSGSGASPRYSMPPTTSSSPNLLSLVSSGVSGSGGSSHGHGHSHGHSHTGLGLFRSTTESSSSPSFDLLRGFVGVGSKASQKAQMSLPLANTSDSTVMQKSKSSSAVVPPAAGGQGQGSSSRLMSKSSRIFKSRSKSTNRGGQPNSGSTSSAPPCSWAPQGKCRWRSPGGKTVCLEATNVLALTELERVSLAEVALEKLKALNLGVEVKIPKEKNSSSKPAKRRPYLLKKKALSTGFFEQGKDFGVGGGTNSKSGMVFGISLSQCVANDRAREGSKGQGQGQPQSQLQSVPSSYKRSQNGSRNSFAEPSSGRGHDEKGSTESLFWGKRGSVAALEPDVLLRPPPPSVPALVRACVQHLEDYGLHTTGIFRVSTSLKRIRQLREEIDGGREVEFGAEHSPHDVAALLKEFLRDLPDPLLSRELYQPFLKTQKIRNRKQQLEAVQHLVQLLPVAHRDTLASLLAFFAKVVANAGDSRGPGGETLPGNKMEGYSLATLIAPNILPCMEGGGVSADATLNKERRESIDVVNYMISNAAELFAVPAELLHDVYLHLHDSQPEGVERLLKLKTGLMDDALDELENSSVFEGSECGELPELEESHPTRLFRKREDILHEGAGRGGPGPPTESSRLRGDRLRGRRESSRDGGEGGGQSGAESDSSSTKSSSRWFRRTRPEKNRTSSDSGSEKVKGSSGLFEPKRANSLDSVAIRDGPGHGHGPGASGSGPAAGPSRDHSASDQSLKVPDNLSSRRQSSPVLESSRGEVITASLKIPVPLPLNIDDIPFIEDEGGPGSHHSGPGPAPHPRSRGRSASTDSSALVKSPSSSHTTTPISSPGRGPSSEVSSPLGFFPPGSPPYDPATFPYEEMTARFLIGGGDRDLSQPPTASSSTTTVTTSSVDRNPAKVVTSLYLQPAANATASGSSSAPPSPQQPHTKQTATASVYIPGIPPDPSRIGKETKGANIGGLIKSKTADFEKLAKTSAASSTASAVVDNNDPSSSSNYSYSQNKQSIGIGPKMRLRSQENIVLKQQFLLRQQQQAAAAAASAAAADQGASGQPTTTSTTHHHHQHHPHPSQEAGRRGRKESESEKLPARSSGPKPLARSRRQLVGSASSSSIVAPSSSSSSSSSPVTSVTIKSSTIQNPSQSQSQGQGQATSPSRWKRSEIIASGCEEPPKETFL